MNYADLYEPAGTFAEMPPAAPLGARIQTDAIATNIKTVQGEVAKFDQIAAGLAAIEAAHPKDVIVADIGTTAGMRVAEAGWRAYRNPRLEVERARKSAKAPVLALGRSIDAFADQITTRLLAGEDHYKAQIDAETDRQAAEKAERERVELLRKANHEAGLARIRSFLARCQEPGMTAARIAAGIETLGAMTWPVDQWEEYAVPAANAQCETLEAMRVLHAQTLGREVEAARLELQRQENERQAAENAAAAARIAAETAAIRRRQEALDTAERLAAAARQVENDRIHAAPAGPARDGSQKPDGDAADAPSPELAAKTPDDRGGSLPGTPGPCASSAAESATAAPSGAEGEGAHADTSAPVPALRPDGSPKQVITVELDDTPPAPLPPVPEPATVSLGALKTDILGPQQGFTEAFIENALGVKAHRDGKAVLYTATERRQILAAFITRLQGLL